MIQKNVKAQEAGDPSHYKILSAVEIERLRKDLRVWYDSSRRDLPWRRTHDPYAIWISEIMLQQTRVAAVIPYYERFLERFPDFHALANTHDSELLSYWAGLGYYYRARNLQRAAQQMRDAGSFPSTYGDIRRLPGIGEYTAAAIASIAFNLPHAVVDGNVFRVLSRIFNDPTNIASVNARKHFSAIADKLLDREQPGVFNQAVMELGATLCLPKNPQCLLCPVSSICRARRSGRENDLPVKITAQKNVREERVLFWVESGGKVLVWQRPPESRLMPGFWELPEREHLPGISIHRKLGSFRHGITFHNYRFEIVEATVPDELGRCRWIHIEELGTIPMSTVLKKASRMVAQSRTRHLKLDGEVG
ncbi:MAG: A/G-specific adenine glycosylase [Acidobacteriaceae bacterium]|nr:A/G-specific adenine glycosylase [Acidobacteriaceae bacterium]